MATIYTGEEAKTVCNMILNNTDWTAPLKGYDSISKGYWKEGPDRWVAYDNTDGDCWVEEFRTRKEAIKYIEDEEP